MVNGAAGIVKIHLLSRIYVRMRRSKVPFRRNIFVPLVHIQPIDLAEAT